MINGLNLAFYNLVPFQLCLWVESRQLDRYTACWTKKPVRLWECKEKYDLCAFTVRMCTISESHSHCQRVTQPWYGFAFLVSHMAFPKWMGIFGKPHRHFQWGCALQMHQIAIASEDVHFLRVILPFPVGMSFILRFTWKFCLDYFFSCNYNFSVRNMFTNKRIPSASITFHAITAETVTGRQLDEAEQCSWQHHK